MTCSSDLGCLIGTRVTRVAQSKSALDGRGQYSRYIAVLCSFSKNPMKFLRIECRENKVREKFILLSRNMIKYQRNEIRIPSKKTN